MALVWQYGEQSGYESWKGLSWGMVSFSSYEFWVATSIIIDVKWFCICCINKFEFDGV